MRVAIVIPAYNAVRTIGVCLEACLKQTHPVADIVVVDDGSSDETAVIAEGYERVRVIQQANAGPAAARNRGAAATDGDLIAFTDSDCVPHADWIARLVAGFVDENTGGVGGTYGIANPDVALARMIHDEIQMRHERFGSEVDFLGSFNVAYRRTVFEAVGGFDASFTAASAEDNDLAYRILDAGFRLRFADDAIVAHHHPERWWPYLRTQAKHGYWRMRLYWKHTSRVRGDQYASRLELSAPPATLLFTVMLLLAVADTFVRLGRLSLVLVWCVVAVLFSLVLLVNAPRFGRMVRRAGWRLGFEYLVLCYVRDLGRALGVVAGVFPPRRAAA